MDKTQNPPPTPKTEMPALSPRQLVARRANAAKSTGPRTLDGKSVAAMNALKHGFFSHDLVNSNLDGRARVEEFNALLDSLLEEFQPETALERILVDEIAAQCWRIRRILRYECRESWVDEENARHADDTPSPSDNLLASMGYDDRAVRLRSNRKLHRAGLDAFMLPSYSDVQKIVRFERMVKRNLYRALNLLERIRAARRPTESSDAAPASEK
jgi:hypothetical protein